jgi:hypothetical protein
LRFDAFRKNFFFVMSKSWCGWFKC